MSDAGVRAPGPPATRGSAFSKKSPWHEANEDAFLIDDEIGLYVICDGLGGHAHGEVASTSAARAVGEVVRSAGAALDIARADPTRIDELKALLVSAVHRAHDVIRELMGADAAFHGMGTTLTAVVVVGARAVMAHVGDTRLYLVGADGVRLVSRDHTVAAEDVRNGVIEAEDIVEHPERHLLLRALGTDPEVVIDIEDFAVAPGDRLVLVSDGVGDPLEPELMERLAAGLVTTPAEIVERAVEAGTEDDATAVVVEIGGPHGVPQGVVASRGIVEDGSA